MSNEEENVQVVKNFFAAIGSGDKQALLALVDEGMEWIIPGEELTRRALTPSRQSWASSIAP